MRNIDRGEARMLLMILGKDIDYDFKSAKVRDLIYSRIDYREIFLLLLITHPIFPGLFFKNGEEKLLRQKDLMSLDLSHITLEEIDMVVWYFKSCYHLLKGIDDNFYNINVDSNIKTKKEFQAEKVWKAIYLLIPQLILNFTLSDVNDASEKANIKRMIQEEYSNNKENILSRREDFDGEIRNALLGLWGIHIQSAMFPENNYLIKDGTDFINVYRTDSFYKNHQFRSFYE